MKTQEHIKNLDNAIIKLLEEYQKNPDKNKSLIPWLNVNIATPRNAITGESYNGVNILSVIFNCFNQNLNSNYAYCLISFIQANELGLTIKKGSKAIPIFNHGTYIKKNEETKEEERKKYFRHYNMFSLEQIEDIENHLDLFPNLNFNYDKLKENFIKNSLIESFVFNSKINIEYKLSNKACYIPSKDIIIMPESRQFETVECYYNVLFHEMIHATGSKKRLNRELSQQIQKYAFEELIAEIGAIILCMEFNVTNSINKDSIKYIDSWIKALKDNKNSITISKAFSFSSKASNYLLELNKEKINVKELESV